MTETAARRSEAARSRTAPRIRWWLIALLVVGGVVNYLDRGTLSIGNTTIAKDLGFGPIQMGLLLSAFSWPYAIANLPAGYLVDRFGAKRMFTVAAAAWSVVSMATALVRTFPLFYLARTALGVAESPFFTSGLKVTQRWFAKDERSLPLSVVNTGSQIANAIAPPLLTLLLLTMSWQGMFVVVGALGLIVVAAWVRCYRDPTPDEERAIHGDLSEAVAAEKPVGWGALFAQRNTWFMVIGAFGIFYTVWTYLTWLPGYLQLSRGFTLSTTAWLAALPFLCGIVGVLFGGWLSARLVRAGVERIRARKIPIVGGALLAACAVVPVAFIADDTLTVVLLCVGYFAAQVPIGLIWTLASDIADPRQVSSLGSIQNFGGFLGAAIAPIVTGVVVATTGTFTLVFVIGGALLVIGGVSYGVFVKGPKQVAAA